MLLLLALLAVRSANAANLCCYNGSLAFGGGITGELKLCDPSKSGDFVRPTDFDQAADECDTTMLFSGGYAIPGLLCSRLGPEVTGDLHISSFDGTDYILVGKPNATYSLLSERNHQVNIQLFRPLQTREAEDPLSVNAVGVLINSARIAVRLRPGPNPSEPALTMTVHTPGKALTFTWTGQPATHAADAHTSVTFQSPESITIDSSDIVLSVALVARARLHVNFEEVATAWPDVHGIMGQTYSAAFCTQRSCVHRAGVGQVPGSSAAVESKKWLAPEGTEADYITSGLLQADDKFSRFGSAGAGAPLPMSRRMLAPTATAGPTGAARRAWCDAGVSSAINLATAAGRSLGEVDGVHACLST